MTSDVAYSAFLDLLDQTLTDIASALRQEIDVRRCEHRDTTDLAWALGLVEDARS
jgi:hypothetical protein